MRNNIYKILITICFYFNFISSSYSNEDFIFQISEIDIKENGNLIIGSNGGKAITTDGFEVIGEKFNYNKLTNILTVFNNVKLVSKKDQIIILSDKATYLKNDEIIFTEGNSKAFNDEFTLDASKFKFNKNKNILNAEENVKFLDTKDDTTILSDKATYLKNDEIIFTEGNSKAFNDEFTLDASKFKFNKNKNILNAEENVKFLDTKDDTTILSDKATYLKNDEIIFTEGNSKAFNDEFTLDASKFKFNKNKNILNAEENVKFLDTKDDTTILSDKATYLKNDEIIFTEGNSKAFNDEFTLDASKFKFNKNKNILNAEENVKFLDTKDDTTILSDKATYLKNDEIIFTEGSTKGLIQNKYNFNSKDIAYSKIDGYLKSKSKSTIEDDEGNSYELDSFFMKSITKY